MTRQIRLMFSLLLNRTPKIIITGVFFGLMIGALFHLFLPKQYESRALIEVGVAWNAERNVVDGFGTIKNILTKVNLLEAQVFETQKGSTQPYRITRARAQLDPANAKHLYLFVRAASGGAAQHELQQLLAELLNADRMIFQQRQKRLEEEISRYRRVIRTLRKERKQLRTRMGRLIDTKPAEAVLIWFDAQQIDEKLLTHIGESRRLENIQVVTSETSTKVLVPPNKPEGAVTLSIQVLMMLFSVAGLFIGVVLANTVRSGKP
jgi:hypothetical protein